LSDATPIAPKSTSPEKGSCRHSDAQVGFRLGYAGSLGQSLEVHYL